MNPEVKRQWVESLPSGKYQQSKTFLRTESGFCCLGVLCDLYPKTEWQEKKVRLNRKEITVYSTEYGAETGWYLLPYPVQSWAGLPSSNPKISPTGEIESCTLSSFNDDRRLTFLEIANLIEVYL